MFKETSEQTEAWISTKEAFLANEDLGVSTQLSVTFQNFI